VKIVIFTRTGFHHTSFINRLQERFDIACIVREAYPENKKYHISKFFFKNLFQHNGLMNISDEIFLKKFHALYSAGFRYHSALKDYLKSPFDVVLEKPRTKYMDVGCDEINSEDFAAVLRDMKPDVIAVLGSSVIKTHIISIPSVAMINLHSGLSPYYRGTWSYGWPIVNAEPEYIGVTVHRVNDGIDSGDINNQTTPILDERDDLNTIFLKVISEGIELVVDAIEQIEATGRVTSYEQPQNTGRLYLSRDFSAHAARLCLANLENGIIGKYHAVKNERDVGVVLYGYVPPKVSA
jgi:folate-dependent phosphoribosylglycinamide formyltransferase PurN